MFVLKMQDLIAYKIKHQSWTTLDDVKAMKCHNEYICVVFLYVEDDIVNVHLHPFNDTTDVDTRYHHPCNYRYMLSMFDISVQRMNRLLAHPPSIGGIHPHEIFEIPLPRQKLCCYDDLPVMGVWYVCLGFLFKNPMASVKVTVSRKQSILKKLIRRREMQKEWVARPKYHMFAPLAFDKYGLWLYKYLEEDRNEIIFETKDTECKMLCMCYDSYVQHITGSMQQVPELALFSNEMIGIDITSALDDSFAVERCKQRHDTIFEELMRVCWHPNRIQQMVQYVDEC